MRTSIVSTLLGLATLGALALPSTADAAKVVEYLFNGNANDTSGNAEHGVLENGATFGTSFDGSGALSLDGSDDHVSVDIGNYAFSTFTLELWANVPTYNDNVHYISLYQNAYLVLGDYGAGPLSTWADGLNPIDVGGNEPTPTTNAWHHFAFTYDGTTQRLYHDGVEVVSVSTSGSVNNNPSSFNQRLVIGARYTQGTQYVAGLLDNVRIWDEALPASQLGFFTDGTNPDSDGDGDPDSTDCNDSDPTIFTGAPELCDAIDSNCNGDLVDGFTNTDGDLEPDCIDTDDDGDGDPDATDCADLDATIYTGAPELCDAIDSNCNGDLVDGFTNTDGDLEPDCIDTDDDGDGDPDATDCADLDATIYTGAPELCDAIDSDCNGDLVDGFTNTDGDLEPDCIDTDDDGDGDPDVTDCEDLDATIYTGAPELCDAIDSNCNGDLVDGFTNTDGDLEPDCVDTDDDGDGDPDATDCADLDATIYTGAPELCDAIDSNCNGDLVDGFTNTDGDLEPDCVDTDDDGDGDPDVTDCEDLDATIYTGAPELCDAIDSNCDGDLVDGFPDGDGDGSPDCIDNDVDGDGDPATTDCDDNDATVYTGAPELCDLIDSDCDGDLVDTFPDADGDGAPDCIDDDVDGDGDPAATDCDDNDATVYTGAPELCDEIDSDCDGSIVDEFPDADGDDEPDCVDLDADGDGFDDELAGGDDCDDEDASIYPDAPEVCDLIDSDCDGDLVDGEEDLDADGIPDCVDDDQDGDFETAATDCNDNDPTIFTGAPEECDDIDSDCDGDLVDEFENTDTDSEPDCIDEDDDADGTPDTEDCAPLDAEVHPDATEVCDDAIDNDCDGDVDGDDADCASGDDDDVAGCDCEASVGAQGSASPLLFVLGFALLTRRRRTVR